MSDVAMRRADLRQMLLERRLELQDDVRSRIRVGRTSRPNDARDVVDVSDAHIQGDIEFALLQMRSETMIRIDQALVRLDIPQAPMRKIDGYVDYMVAYLNERIRAERTLWGSATPIEIWHSRNRFWAWMITTIIAMLALILGVIGVFT